MDQSTKKTLVLGASDNPARYSYLAVNRLRQQGHPVVAIGKKPAQLGDVAVVTSPAPIPDLNTVTLYLNPDHQKAYYDFILSQHPRRVIFNPGTENPELQQLLDKAKIPYMEACTLVLLSTGQY